MLAPLCVTLRVFRDITRALRLFPARFWVLTTVGGSYYGTILVMVVFARKVFEVRV